VSLVLIISIGLTFGYDNDQFELLTNHIELLKMQVLQQTDFLKSHVQLLQSRMYATLFE